MRAVLVRSTVVGAVMTLLLAWATITAAAVWVQGNRPDVIEQWLTESPAVAATQLAVVGILLTIPAKVVLAFYAVHAGRRIAQPLTELVELAKQVADGSRIDPATCGIREVDELRAVLVRGAHRTKQSLAAERDFASDASHQLRTPLTALLMRLEEIAATDDVELMHEEADIAIAQVERLTKVVDDLLMRRREGPEKATPEVSLDSVLAGLQREWQPAFEGARRSIRVRGERGLVVRATPVALSQVLSTLLENSLVHGRGTVDIDARRSGPSVVVEVSDQGDGVPAAIAPHIFERSVSSGAEGSTGLGLALARDLAESHGGRLDLIQAQPATFALFLSESELPQPAVSSPR